MALLNRFEDLDRQLSRHIKSEMIQSGQTSYEAVCDECRGPSPRHYE